jgi:hypothetical protein
MTCTAHHMCPYTNQIQEYRRGQARSPHLYHYTNATTHPPHLTTPHTPTPISHHTMPPPTLHIWWWCPHIPPHKCCHPPPVFNSPTYVFSANSTHPPHLTVPPQVPQLQVPHLQGLQHPPSMFNGPTILCRLQMFSISVAPPSSLLPYSFYHMYFTDH